MAKRKQIYTPEELYSLEAHLAGTLRPVAPPRDLIQRLQERVRMPIRDEITWRLQDWRSLFLVFSSVMSGMLVIITIARALFYFWERRHTG